MQEKQNIFRPEVTTLMSYWSSDRFIHEYWE